MSLNPIYSGYSKKLQYIIASIIRIQNPQHINLETQKLKNLETQKLPSQPFQLERLIHPLIIDRIGNGNHGFRNIKIVDRAVLAKASDEEEGKHHHKKLPDPLSQPEFFSGSK